MHPSGTDLTRNTPIVPSPVIDLAPCLAGGSLLVGFLGRDVVFRIDLEEVV